ncbi:MAG: amino acid permease [Candidatus Eremiobacterota bacterium]
MDLPRRLSRLDATTVVIGSMIGAGIFLKAAAIAQLLPDPKLALAVWVVAGALSLFGALSLAELGAMHPHSGGLYVYLREAYGPVVAYLFGWSLLAVMQTGSIAGIAAGVSQNVAELNPGMPQWIRFSLDGSLIMLLTAANIWSVRAGAGIQNAFTAAKCLGILALIVGGFTAAGGSLENFRGAALPTGLALVGAFGTCMLKAMWAYDGWINATFVAGEVRDPQRNLPRALAVGTGLVMLVYVLTNAAYHYGLPLLAVQEAESPAGALGGAIGGFLGHTDEAIGMGATAIVVLATVSTFGALNSSIMTGPRVYYAMARDGLFFKELGAVHAVWLTPWFALAVQGVWSIALLQFWKSFETITDNVMFIYWIFYAMGGVAVFLLRARMPDAERPYRVWGYPLVPLAFVGGALFLIVNTIVENPKNSAQALVLLAVGLVLYPLIKRPQAGAQQDER